MRNRYPKAQIIAQFLFFAVCVLGNTLALQAQLPIKGVYTTRYKATTGSTYVDTISTGSGLSGKYTYNYGTNTVSSNNYLRLDTFTVGNSIYVFDNAATPVVKFRRVNNAWVTGNRKSLWMETDGNTPSSTVPIGLRPSYEDSLETIFAKRLFNMGVDNAFENNNGTNNNDIERIDIIFRTGLRAINPDSAGFTVFDRGAAGSNDSFQVAAIKAVDANGDPSDYYPAVKVGPLNYGNAAGTALTFLGLRKDDGEAHLKMFIAAQSQAREGVYFSFRSLGFTASSATSTAAIYGYSIMATDVNRAAPGTPKNMVSYTNATIFPTNTELGSVGGIDMVAVTGVAATTTTAAMLTLPVRLDNFTARLSGDKVLINWQLSPGNDLIGQYIEKSNNGITFTTLDSYPINPAGGIQNASDEHPSGGPNYYRLRMVDNAGDFSYSDVALVTLNSNGTAPASLGIYPVPVTGNRFTIRSSGLPNTSCLLEIMDMNGNRLLSQKTTAATLVQKQVILPAPLPAGTYTVLISDANGTKLVAKKIMVE